MLMALNQRQEEAGSRRDLVKQILFVSLSSDAWKLETKTS